MGHMFIHQKVKMIVSNRSTTFSAPFIFINKVSAKSLFSTYHNLYELISFFARVAVASPFNSVLTKLLKLFYLTFPCYMALRIRVPYKARYNWARPAVGAGWTMAPTLFTERKICFSVQDI